MTRFYTLEIIFTFYEAMQAKILEEKAKVMNEIKEANVDNEPLQREHSDVEGKGVYCNSFSLNSLSDLYTFLCLFHSIK